ncbi:MAG TPA: MarR family transcriptional regulator [Nitrolancea sp.]|nr:MarR family transcriptional regulator [Nitrolancea sp.]
MTATSSIAEQTKSINDQGVEEAVDTDGLVDLLQQTLAEFHPSLTELTEVWSDVNVTIQQLRVMTILYNDGPRRVSLLARRLSVSTPTMTGILDRLVRQDLISRQDDPEDRRVVLNALTEKGQGLIERLQPVQSDRLRAIVSQLASSERQEVVSGLSSLLTAARATE